MSIPKAVSDAKKYDWKVVVDAYLFGAGKVGEHYAAHAYFDLSGTIGDGETILTPPVRVVARRDGYTLVQSECGGDHYVLVSSMDQDESAYV